MNEQEKEKKNWADYYDHKDILDEITDEPVDLSLDDHLRQDVLSHDIGLPKRSRKN